MDSADAEWYVSAGPAACTGLAPVESDDELELQPGTRGPEGMEGKVRLGAETHSGPFPRSSRCRIPSGKALTWQPGQLGLQIQGPRGLYLVNTPLPLFLQRQPRT